MTEHRADESGGEDEAEARRSSERIVGLWPGASPPDGFAGAVLDAAVAAGRGADARRRTGRRVAVGLIALAAGAVAVLLLMLGGPRGPLGAGARVTVARETLDIAGRAVAVAEPGAALAWQVTSAGATVEHSRGSAFYRVDRGATPFAVVTPGGRVTVRGTCFRIDVAARTATVVVYEGAVTAETERGVTPVGPGQQAVLAPDRAPVVLPGASTAEDERAPSAREAAYRAEIAALQRRVAELEHESAGQPGPVEPGEPPPDKYEGFTRDELLAMARRCELRYDIPGYAYESEYRLTAATAARLGISDAEREAIDRINREGDPQLLEQTRDLYIELIGDRAVAETLEPRTLQHEIFLKSRRGDPERAAQRVSAERAGLARPPASGVGLSPVERLMRLLVSAGDRYQERLAAALGPPRAAQLRRLHAGMGLRSSAGCPED